MAGITGQGTTFGLPNYTGELMQISPSETPFLSAIGGLNGGKAVHDTSSSGSSTTCAPPRRTTPSWKARTPDRG
jgi:hypothetical protein